MVRVTRIVPDLPVSDVARASAFYADLLDLEVGMDQAWVGTVVAPHAPSVQLTVLAGDATGPLDPVISIGVDDVDAVYARAVAAGVEIVQPSTDERWGVRRFFFRDPDGNVVNVITHRRGGPRA